MENVELNEKFYLLGFDPEQTNAMDWFILLFLCSIVLSSIILWKADWNSQVYVGGIEPG